MLKITFRLRDFTVILHLVTFLNVNLFYYDLEITKIWRKDSLLLTFTGTAVQ